MPAVLVTQGYTWDFAKDVLDQVQQPPLPQVSEVSPSPLCIQPSPDLPGAHPAHTCPQLMRSSPRGRHQVVITNHRFAHSQSAAVTMPAFAADFAKNEGRYWRDLNDSAAKGTVNVHGVKTTVPRYVRSPCASCCFGGECSTSSLAFPHIALGMCRFVAGT